MSRSAEVDPHDPMAGPHDRHDGDDRAPHKTNQIALGAGIAVFLGMMLFWAAIFSGAFTSRNPDKLHDTDWVSAAALVCKPTAAAIGKLPNASTSKSAADRAALIDQGTDLLEPMVAKLKAIPAPDRASDRTIVSGMFEDWTIYLQDRRNFSVALRKDPKAKPLMTESHGGWGTDAIQAMTDANDIPDCATPGDM